MDSLLSICIDPNENDSLNTENSSVTPTPDPGPLTPVQNSITLRLQKLMNEKKICLRIDTNAEIDLNEEEDDENVELKKSPVRQAKNPMDEWFRKRTPKASPANKKKKLSLLKKELLDKMIAQRREEQESRRRVFRADNEIFDDDEEEEAVYSGSEIDEENGSTKDYKEDILEDEQSDNDYLANDENNESDQEDQESINEEESDSELPQNDNDFIDDKASDSDLEDESCQNKSPNSENAIGFNEEDEQSNTGINSNSCGLSSFLANNENQKAVIEDDSQKESHTTSTISLHKTESIPQIGSQFLCGELDSQPINSQQLANEMQNLMDEQHQLAISERENYELLLDLTKFDKEPTIMLENLNEEEDEITVSKKLHKRKRQIESDDEDEFNEDFPTTPSSEVKKLPKIITTDDDELFQIDDGEDRLELESQSKPFVDTYRIMFDEDSDEEDIELEYSKKVKTKVSFAIDDQDEEVDFEEEIDEQIEEVGGTKSKNKWIDDEASLSGSDLGSGDEVEGDDLDVYEPMEGDNDELPEESEIREGIIKTHMKLQNIDEERHLNKLKEMFDTEINPSNQWDRSFRSRLHEQELDFKSLVGDPLNVGNTQSDDDEEDEIITFKDHLAKKESEEQEEENRRLFTLAAIADDLSQEGIDTEASLISKKYTHNPNGIAKFIVENYEFQQDDSHTIP